MPQRCTVCVDSHVSQLNEQLRNGRDVRALAREFGLSHQAVIRHRDNWHARGQLDTDHAPNGRPVNRPARQDAFLTSFLANAGSVCLALRGAVASGEFDQAELGTWLAHDPALVKRFRRAEKALRARQSVRVACR